MKSYQELREEAKALLLKGSYRFALARHQDLLSFPQAQKDLHIIHTNLGLALQFLQRRDQALKQFEQALSIEGEYLKAQYRLLQVLSQAGKWTEFLDYYLKFPKVSCFQEVQQITEYVLSQINKPVLPFSHPLFTRLTKQLALRAPQSLFQTLETADQKGALAVIVALSEHGVNMPAEAQLCIVRLLNEPQIHKAMRLIPFKTDWGKRVLKAISDNLQSLLSGQGKINVLELIKALDEKGAERQTLISFFEGNQLWTQKLVGVREFQALQGTLIRLISKAQPDYFTLQQVQQEFSLQNFIVSKNLQFKVSDSFKLKAVAQPALLPYLPSFLHPFKAQIPYGPPLLFQERILYFNLRLVLKNEWDGEMQKFLAQLIKQQHQRGLQKKYMPEIYYSLTLMASHKQALSLIYQLVQQLKFPEFLRHECQFLNYLLFVLVQPYKKPQAEIPDELLHLLKTEPPIVPSNIFLKNLPRYLPRLKLNSHTVKVVKKILEADQNLVQHFLYFILQDSGVYAELCRWMKDHSPQWKLQRACARRILSMLESLTHEFDIFSGLLGILNIWPQSKFQIESSIEILEKMLMEENQYIVAASLKIVNNALLQFSTLRERKLPLEIAVAYHKGLEPGRSSLPLTDFSHPNKIFVMATCIILQYYTVEKQSFPYKSLFHDLERCRSRRHSFLRKTVVVPASL